jgi:hypothetical protein
VVAVSLPQNPKTPFLQIENWFKLNTVGHFVITFSMSFNSPSQD